VQLRPLLAAAGLSLVVTVGVLGAGAVVAFMAMVALNGFPERTGAIVLSVLGLLVLACNFGAVTLVSRSLLARSPAHADRRTRLGLVLGAVFTLAPVLLIVGAFVLVNALA
jgi:hypothetical protein